MAVRIVTDSASDLPSELVAAEGIGVVALDVRLGALDPHETASLDPAAFWEVAGRTPELPETSAPSPGAFQEAFLKANDGDGVICVTISAALSATFQSARAAASALDGQVDVEVIDSRFATMGEGLLVLEAVERARQGQSVHEVAGGVREEIAKTRTFGTLDTLDNLKRGGRIGGAQAFFGSLLAIKPVIEVREGVVEPDSRQRTRSRSLHYLAGKVAEQGPLKRLAVVHAAASDVEDFLTMLTPIFPRDETIVSYIGPVIGTHTGAGTVGVCFQIA